MCKDCLKVLISADINRPVCGQELFDEDINILRQLLTLIAELLHIRKKLTIYLED